MRQFRFVLAANSAYRAKLLALDFSPNDPIGSRQNWKNPWLFEYKYPVHNHNIHSLATTNCPISPRQTLFHFPLIIILGFNANSKIILRQSQNLSEPKVLIFSTELVLAANSALQNQPTRSRFLTKWSYWLSPNTWQFEYKYPVHNHNVHSLATNIYPTFPRRNSFPPLSHQYSGNIQRLFINNPKIFKDKSSAPENNQRLFRLQNCLSRKSSTSRKYSKTFRPASSNQQALTSSSNQQWQPAAAINNSNQQQQAATRNSNHRQQPAVATRIRPTSSTYTINACIC